MDGIRSPMTAKDALDLYFIDNRARLLDIASFLDRIDRYDGGNVIRNDFRYASFIAALKAVALSPSDRTGAVQQLMSDPTTAPLDRIDDPRAYGAWKGFTNEDN